MNTLRNILINQEFLYRISSYIISGWKSLVEFHKEVSPGNIPKYLVNLRWNEASAGLSYDFEYFQKKKPEVDSRKIFWRNAHENLCSYFPKNLRRNLSDIPRKSFRLFLKKCGKCQENCWIMNSLDEFLKNFWKLYPINPCRSFPRTPE